MRRGLRKAPEIFGIFSGRINGMSRNIVVLSDYIAPRTRAKQTEEALACMNGLIAKVKEDFVDPISVIGGDFNGRDLDPAIDDFPDLKCIHTGPTRGDRTLDLVFTNLEGNNPSDTELISSVEKPLETDDGSKKSDHSVIYVRCLLSHVDRFTVNSFQTRPQTAEGHRRFENWIRSQSWDNVTREEGSSKAAALMESLDNALVRSARALMNVYTRNVR